MSLQEVFDLLGAPAMQLMRNAGEGKIETTWTYLFDGGFEKAVRFGVPIAPETQVLQSAFAGNPQDYATADLSELGLKVGETLRLERSYRGADRGTAGARRLRRPR